MTEHDVLENQWSRAKNRMVVSLIAAVILVVFGGVIWWVVFLFSGPNYRVQPTLNRSGNPGTSLVITSNDELSNSDYETITAKMWQKYGAVQVLWQCGNGSIRGRSSQSSAESFTGTKTWLGC